MKIGGFLTEFWHDDPPQRENFLKRNRIVAGISKATIIIESAEKGGSLVTADIANSYNRDVFALPGRASDIYSKGCNDLNEKEQKVYDLLHLKGQQDIDAISFASNIPVFQLSPLLLQLEMKGVLKPLPGKLFELI